MQGLLRRLSLNPLQKCTFRRAGENSLLAANSTAIFENLPDRIRVASREKRLPLNDFAPALGARARLRIAIFRRSYERNSELLSSLQAPGNVRAAGPNPAAAARP